MVLKLYSGTPTVGGASLVAITLIEKQVPFEHVLVDLTLKQQKLPEHIARHPFGQVPVIDDDGFILYEGRAICRYLADKYAAQGTPGLIPPASDFQARGRFEAGASFEVFNFYPHMKAIWAEIIPKHNEGLPIDQAGLDAALAALNARLDVYEVILGQQQYIAGDTFTVADILHLMHAPTLLKRTGIDVVTSEERPNVTRWWRDITGRPSVREVIDNGVIKSRLSVP
ncbi:unnamed protein product [Mycena citricolor]|uniref:glutathione transferase n=1 Tax=Mycena citricolor TaxID=2018698 RepID=A0AAD2I201_9AGAR|nr:unnamed protein product [Mycena citricolor]CAK5284991.1 unnamed protein product [Mycena citricolor]